MEETMSRILIATATTVTGLALLTGCGLVPKATAAIPATTVTATQSASVTATQSTSPGYSEPAGSPQATDTATPGNGATYADAKAAAEALVAAWHIGDKNAALLAAGPQTVEKVFSSVVDTDAKIQACVPGAQSGVSYAYDCYYHQNGQFTHFYVDAYAPSGWRVVDYKQVAG
jgi:hypothetical protein